MGGSIKINCFGDTLTQIHRVGHLKLTYVATNLLSRKHTYIVSCRYVRSYIHEFTSKISKFSVAPVIYVHRAALAYKSWWPKSKNAENWYRRVFVPYVVLAHCHTHNRLYNFMVHIHLLAMLLLYNISSK